MSLVDLFFSNQIINKVLAVKILISFHLFLQLLIMLLVLVVHRAALALLGLVQWLIEPD